MGRRSKGVYEGIRKRKKEVKRESIKLDVDVVKGYDHSFTYQIHHMIPKTRFWKEN